MPDPDPPTLQQLKDMAVHIYHEVMALMQSRDLLNHARAQHKAAQEKVLQDACQVGINCALESFLLHYRNLREFLNDEVKQSKKNKATSKPESDDIKAKDYTIDPNWKTAAPWASNKDEGKRLHKRLAHVTTARLTLDDKWYPESMEGNTLRTFEDFVSALSDERKAWFENASKAITARVRPVMTTLGESSNTLSVSRHSMTFHGFGFK
jgi:hypothetical protein